MPHINLIKNLEELEHNETNVFNETENIFKVNKSKSSSRTREEDMKELVDDSE